MYGSVVSVKALKDFKLLLRFENAEERIFDVRPFLTMGKFIELKEPSMFNSVRISFDTISWSNQLDLDPEFLYDTSVPVDTASKKEQRAYQQMRPK